MTIKINILSFICFLFLLVSCSEHPTKKNEIEVSTIAGDTVSELGKNIMVIYQAKNDDYWFGSWETGVYKYDGVSIINYSTKNGLPSNRIDEIKEDQFGNLYFCSLYPKTTITKFDGNVFTSLLPIVNNDWQLNESDLWFKHSYDFENKVYRYDGLTLSELQLPPPPDLNDPFAIYSIYKDSKGNLWFGTNPVGVCRYDGKSFEWITEEDITEFRNEGANGVRSIAEDKNGDFWFNTEFRYSLYDSITLEGNQFYTRHQSIGGLDGKTDSDLDEYLSTVKDNYDNLWFVTYRDGVWKYDGTIITHYEVQDNFKNITLFSIYKDNNGELWLGTHENGTFKFNGTSFEKFIK